MPIIFRVSLNIRISDYSYLGETVFLKIKSPSVRETSLKQTQTFDSQMSLWQQVAQTHSVRRFLEVFGVCVYNLIFQTTFILV